MIHKTASLILTTLAQKCFYWSHAGGGVITFANQSFWIKLMSDYWCKSQTWHMRTTKMLWAIFFSVICSFPWALEHNHILQKLHFHSLDKIIYIYIIYNGMKEIQIVLLACLFSQEHDLLKSICHRKYGCNYRSRTVILNSELCDAIFECSLGLWFQKQLIVEQCWEQWNL